MFVRSAVAIRTGTCFTTSNNNEMIETRPETCFTHKLYIIIIIIVRGTRRKNMAIYIGRRRSRR